MKKKHLKSNSNCLESDGKIKALCSLIIQKEHVVETVGETTCKNCIDLHSRKIFYPRGKITHLKVRDGRWTKVSTGCGFFIDPKRATENYERVTCKSCLDYVDRESGAWKKAKDENPI